MSRSLVVLRFALGELLAGRRLPIVAALVALPLWLPSLLAPSSGQDPTSFGLDLFRNLVVPVLLPVVSFAFSTAALGNELRRGTITNLLLKPVPRWSVLGAEYLAAVLATLLVLLPAEVVGHLLVARGLGSAVLLEGMLAATVEGVLAAILDNGGGPELATRLGPVSATTLALVVTVLALALARGRLARMDLP